MSNLKMKTSFIVNCKICIGFLLLLKRLPNKLIKLQVDVLNEEVAKMKAQEKMHQMASDKRQEEVQMKEALEGQIEQHREQHAKQVSALRNEIEEKQSAIATLKDENQKLTLAFEQLQRDHDKLKEEEGDKSKKLNVSVNIKWQILGTLRLSIHTL